MKPILSHYFADRSSLSLSFGCCRVLPSLCILHFLGGRQFFGGKNNSNCHPIKLKVNMGRTLSLYQKCCEIELALGDEHGKPGLIEGDIPSLPLTGANL